MIKDDAVVAVVGWADDRVDVTRLPLTSVTVPIAELRVPDGSVEIETMVLPLASTVVIVDRLGLVAAPLETRELPDGNAEVGMSVETMVLPLSMIVVRVGGVDESVAVVPVP